MKRTGFKRPQIERKRTVHTPAPAGLAQRVTMGASVTAAQPKPVEHRNPALLAMARGRDCQMRLPDLCGNRTDTVVAAHSNLAEHGKSLGRKANDQWVVHACHDCHQWLDQGPATYAEKRASFLAAHARQVAAWSQIAADNTEPLRFRKAAAWALEQINKGNA